MSDLSLAVPPTLTPPRLWSRPQSGPFALPNVATIAGLLVALTGIAVLLGWALDVEWLKRGPFHAPPTMPNTAVALLAAALALLILPRDPRDPRGVLVRVARALTLVPLTIGALTLAEHVSGIDLGIDRVLFNHADGSAFGMAPGRPAANTALNLVLAGSALLALGSRGSVAQRLAQTLALAVAVIAMVSLLGAFFGGSGDVGIGLLDRMAVPTAVSFVLLAAGLLCARPGTAWMALLADRGAGGRMARAVLPITIVAPALLGWLRLEGQELGLYDLHLGAALYAMALIAVLACVVLWSATAAARMDHALHDSHAALKQREALLAETQRISRVGGWEYDPQTNRVKWTDETYRIFGLPRDATPVGPAQIEAFFPGEGGTALGNALRAAVETGAPYDMEVQARTTQGELAWVRVVGQAERQGNTVVRVSGILADITARKEAELAQRRYAERLRVVNRLDHVISSTFDVEIVYDIFIDELKRLFPFDRASLVLLSPDRARWQIVRQWTQGPARLPARQWRPVHGSAIEWLMENRRSLHEYDVGERKFSEDAALAEEGLRSCLLTPLVFGGEMLGALGLGSRQPVAYGPDDAALFEALADQMAIALNNARLYEQVQQQAALLERRVRERTAQLESAVKDLEGFSYSVSHDLRAPLRAIDSFSDILAQEHAHQLDAEGRRLCGIVRENTAKMGRLIDDILAFSRAGRRELVLADVDMDALVADVIAELRPARATQFVVAPLPRAQADRAALRQVLVNLLANAVKFTGRVAAPRVEVSGDEHADGWTYHVRDNGAGFDPRYRHKLFGVFQRLHGPEEFEGTGIGLAIVKRVVEKHGGRVDAHGEPGAGARFTFHLPRPAAEHPQENHRE